MSKTKITLIIVGFLWFTGAVVKAILLSGGFR